MTLKPIHTIIIVLVFLLIGGPAAWFTSIGLTPSGPGDVGLDTRGNLYAHYNDKVFGFDSAGNPRGGSQY